MNILSISQVQTQAPLVDFSQELSQSQKSTSSEKASFADLLREAKNASSDSKPVKTEKSEENVPAEAEKIAKNDENVDSSKVSDKKAENVPEKNEKSEKLTKKKSSDEVENFKNLAKANSDEETLAAQNMNLVGNYRIQKIAPQNEDLASAEAIDGLAENSEIDDKMLAWLVASTKDVENEDISNEDFAALIDAAVEFIPGSETEEEKLVSAQNLAVSDPKLFLEVVENADSLASEAGKSDLALDDKKLAV